MASAALPSAMASSRQSVSIYDGSAEQIAAQYESTTFDEVHAGTLDFLPHVGAAVLDVGAGSGRDAAALVERGYRVTAVEPSHGLRKEALRRHRDVAIEWLDDALPDLAQLGRRQFAFILVSAVWMHLVPHDRPIAMRRLSSLLEPDGRLVISIRRGAADPLRAIADIKVSEVQANAAGSRLHLVRRLDAADALGRSDVAWSTLVLEKCER